MMLLELAILLLLPGFDPHLGCKTQNWTLTIVLQSAIKEASFELLYSSLMETNTHLCL